MTKELPVPEIKLLKIQKNFLMKSLQYHSTTSLTCLIYLILSILKLTLRDGLEKEIIEGLEKNLKDKKVNSLLVELDFDDNAKDIINYLNSLGYVEDKKFTNLRNHSDET